MILSVPEVLVVGGLHQVILADLAPVVHAHLLVLVGALNSLNGQVYELSAYQSPSPGDAHRLLMVGDEPVAFLSVEVGFVLNLQQPYNHWVFFYLGVVVGEQVAQQIAMLLIEIIFHEHIQEFIEFRFVLLLVHNLLQHSECLDEGEFFLPVFFLQNLHYVHILVLYFFLGAKVPGILYFLDFFEFALLHFQLYGFFPLEFFEFEDDFVSPLFDGDLLCFSFDPLAVEANLPVFESIDGLV